MECGNDSGADQFLTRVFHRCSSKKIARCKPGGQAQKFSSEASPLWAVEREKLRARPHGAAYRNFLQSGGEILGLTWMGGLIAILASSLAFMSCSSSSLIKNPQAPSIVKTCVLPDDQSNSLQGHWGTLPIKVSFHNGDFGPDEITALQNAVQTWNDFFQQTKGITVFESGPPGSGNQSVAAQSTPTCSGSTISDGTVIYKRSSTWTKSASAVALTTFCTTLDNPTLPTIFNAIMEMNYKNFFADGTNRFPDLQSIALHELGHLLGLDHSCGPLGKQKVGLPNIACPDQSADPGNFLLRTVMFPQVFFDTNSGLGEVKQALTDNDEGRANCLYSPGGLTGK